MSEARPKLLYFVTVDWFFCSHFIERAIAARDAGYEVLVLTHVDRHGDQIQSEGLRLIPLDIDRRSINPFTALKNLLSVVRVYRTEKPLLVHHLALKPILIGTVAANIANVPHIVNAIVGGGYALASSPGRPVARIIAPLLRWSLNVCLNPRGSKVVFENRDDLNTFVQSGSVSSADAVLIRGAGVDPAAFYATDRTKRVPTVVLGARLLWDKGIGEFVEAARILRARKVNARFVIVGGEDTRNRACIDQKTLDGWRSEGAVELWGYRNDMPDILANATIACLPSYREGLPKFLLESMASGLPCVTTNAPGCREAVCHGDNGLLVPPRDPVALADALQKLLEDNQLATQMGNRGQQKAKTEFSSELIIRQTLELYEAMTALKLGRQLASD